MKTATTTIPAESGHWYTRQGDPRYEVPYADPKRGLRPTTLRDARKLDLVPSVTGIIKECNKPALNYWKENQIMLAALTLPRIDGESDESFCNRVRIDARKEASDKAALGTAIHAALEKYFGGKPQRLGYMKQIAGVVRVLEDRFGNAVPWLAEHSFAHPFGYGGKNDLHARDALLFNDEKSLASGVPDYRGITLDFKTKEGDQATFDKLKTYKEHGMQLAACAEGLLLPESYLGIVYVSTTHPGVARLIEVEYGEHMRMFLDLLDFWQADREYESSFDNE